MPTIDLIENFADELTAIRRDFHAHPEIGFEEHRTSGIVADKLKQWGVEVHRGIGGTGVIGVLKGKGGGAKRIGLRADMDALPMEENTNLPWRSTIPGRFHGCGHDGHTTMLLGTARYLAETRNFDGTAVFIFQPAEEGLGGARAMLKDDLFKRFPCDEIYGLHNAPDLDHGKVAVFPGPAMAGADFFDIHITGYGSHGAMPDKSKDPVVIAMTLGQALQSIVSRNVNPLKSAVLSITKIHAGSAYNVIPGEAHIGGTTRTTTPENRALIERRIDEICEGAAKMHGVKIEVEHKPGYPPTVNDVDQARFAADVATGVCGEHAVKDNTRPSMGAEDFSYMLEKRPGAFVKLGQKAPDGKGGVPVHHPKYDFNDDAAPYGVGFFSALVEQELPRG